MDPDPTDIKIMLELVFSCIYSLIKTIASFSLRGSVHMFLQYA